MTKTEISPQHLERRLEDLRGELRRGEERLRELDGERMRVHDAVLRVEGAILVLEELRGGQANGRPVAGTPSGDTVDP